ncbi:hypothetical protein SASPL_148820 [Salvia splendens]|uniref:Uncharacterized protein n=1 Tax=Salvia splendens TaxID=180675 RepID=A0A8X8WA19_SALSN|nr:hypothetical protein SASPL_148820 [Salvia splendens]
MDSPLQSSFLYHGKWKHEIDMVRLKNEYGCEGSVFPSHYIFEAQSVVEYHFRVTFEWFEIVDRLHFLEHRYRTFKELLSIAGTYWNQPSNKINISANTWASRLLRNHLFGAYHSSGDPAYKELLELFAVNETKQEIDGTLIVLSDSVPAEGRLTRSKAKRASAARTAVSGLVLVSKACGNDVPSMQVAMEVEQSRIIIRALAFTLQFFLAGAGVFAATFCPLWELMSSTTSFV